MRRLSADGTTENRLFVESLQARLDDLASDAFDALPFGAIQVDAQGIIHRYNAMESRLSGRQAGCVIGRDFFREVAPCTNIPSFEGRFRDGVAAGSLDVAFSFVFDFMMAPVKVEVRMMAAALPGRYWILVKKLGELPAHRPADAVELVTARLGARVTGEVVDHSVCEREAIHLPGSIQPWGVLLAFDPGTLELAAASDNALELLGRDLPPGTTLDRAVGVEAADGIRAWMAATAFGRADGGSEFWRGEAPLPDRFDLAAHRTAEHLIVELEPLSGRTAQDTAGLLRRLEAELGLIRTAPGMAVLVRRAAEAVRALTGFERVIVYRFDGDWHGEVMAESLVPDWEQSFAGLHFPASDIPRQARALYHRSLSRHVPNRDFVPVPLRGAAGTGTIDLSLARHRSLSPIHLEYHRNMGVNGSMSLSILVGGRLWGLVACHHRLPHYVDPQRRAAAGTLVEALSLRIAAVEAEEATAGRDADTAVLTTLTVQMAAADTVRSALFEGEVRLDRLFGATGAALCLEGRLATVGDCPPEPVLRALAEWLDGRWDAGGLFQTDSLPSVWPEGAAHRGRMSGVLALRLEGGDYVLWLRPEEPRNISWGGNPGKPVATEGGVPLPRANFERWEEERRGHSLPWSPWAAEIARSLRHSINDVMLRHLRHVKELSERLAASNRVKSEFLANMSHELRTPLNAIMGFSELLLSGVTGALASRHAEYVRDIHDSGGHLLAMVNDVLDLSRIEAGRLELFRRPVDAAEAVEGCVAMLRPRAVQRDIALVPAGGDGLMADADPVRLRQILLNIVGNAVKFSPRGGRVEIGAARDGGMIRFTVADAGPGMSEADVRLAMEPFRQVAHIRSDLEGTGLGLPIARSLAALHGGSLAVESEPGRGTRVHIVLPAALLAEIPRSIG